MMPAAYTQDCELCGRRATNRHEKLPRGRGGKIDRFNCAYLCGSGTTGCHGWVTAHPRRAQVLGMYVAGYMLDGRYHGPDEHYRSYYNGGDAA